MCGLYSRSNLRAGALRHAQRVGLTCRGRQKNTEHHKVHKTRHVAVALSSQRVVRKLSAIRSIKQGSSTTSPHRRQQRKHRAPESFAQPHTYESASFLGRVPSSPTTASRLDTHQAAVGRVARSRARAFGCGRRGSDFCPCQQCSRTMVRNSPNPRTGRLCIDSSCTPRSCGYSQ